MLKNVRKSKILLSVFAIILMIVLFGNVYSLATEGNTQNTSNNPVTIKATTDNTGATNTNTNSANVGANTNNSVNTNNVVNAPNITASVNNSTNNNTANNASNNTSTYNNTNNTSKSSSLPYTGSDSKTVLLIVVFAISAVYAYKKVSDYNV